MAEKSELKKTAVAYAAVALTLLGVWQIVSFMFPDFLFPGTWQVVRRLSAILQTPEFLEGLAGSFFRLAAGYIVALVLGTAAGLLAGIWNAFRFYLHAMISVAQAVPPVTWVPLLVILLGFGDLPIIIVVGIAAFFPMAQTTMGAAEGIPKIHIQVARTLGATRGQLLRTVYLPGIFSAVVTGAQISFGNAWRSLVASEMIGGVAAGLGWSISFSGETADMAGVLSYIVVIGVLASLIDRVVMERVKRRLLNWRYA